MVRTFPVSFTRDYVERVQTHAWHQLTYALRGHLEVTSGATRALVPPNGAIWIPAGLAHGEIMRAPVAVRMLYIAPGAMPEPPPLQTVAVSGLLRELIGHITSLGALDNRVPRQGRLIGVLLDLIAELPAVPLQLRYPADPRARQLAELIEAEPGNRAPLSELAARAGASLRTLERCFSEDTGLTLGQWRRRSRLLAALRLLDDGMSVTRCADEVGYATASAFSAAFTRAFGHPPTQRSA